VLRYWRGSRTGPASGTASTWRWPASRTTTRRWRSTRTRVWRSGTASSSMNRT